MTLQNHLAEKKSELFKKWREAVISSYPHDTQRFLRSEKNKFANPVGNVLVKDMGAIYDELMGECDKDRVSEALGNIIRVRAVQDFKPSQAVSFIFDLKQLVRDSLRKDANAEEFAEQMLAFENKIDQIILLAFDIYAQCRQKISDIKVNEVKNQVGRLLERANLVCEIPECSSGA